MYLHKNLHPTNQLNNRNIHVFVNRGLHRERIKSNAVEKCPLGRRYTYTK